jgi:uncharacterized protein (TIGR03067 family)
MQMQATSLGSTLCRVMRQCVALKIFVVLVSIFALSPCVIASGAGNLNGEWKVSKAVFSGTEATDAVVDDLPRWIIRGKSYDLQKGNSVTPFRWTRDESRLPYTFDAEYAGDDERLKKEYAGGIKGIYRMRNGKLERCFADPGKQRPTDFTSTPSNGWTLIVLDVAE